MKVSDLTIGHIGQHITVTGPAGVVAGRLVSIEAEAEVFKDQVMFHGDTNKLPSGDVIIGRTEVVLVIGRARVPVRTDNGVEIG